MDTPNYGRTVALTQETLAAMSERQQKQKALKDELDRQISERRSQTGVGAGADTSGMTKAQKKRLELQELRGQQQQPPSLYQTQSLPQNFELPQTLQPQTSFFPNVNQRNEYSSPPNAVHETRSLPANFMQSGFAPTLATSPTFLGNGQLGSQVARGNPPSSSTPSYSAPRQVFNISDVLGFAKMATSEPQTEPYPSAPVTSPPAKGSALPTSGQQSKAHPQGPSPSSTQGNGIPTSPSPGQQRSTSSSQSKDRLLQNKMGKLQKELENRDLQMQKMMEKNKNWEQQASQLKQQLKDERKKNKVQVPARAETAPQPPAPPVTAPKRRLDPIERPSNAMAGSSRPKVASGVLSSSPKAPHSTLVPTKGGTYLGRDEKRPITAPDVLDPTTHLLRSGHLPPLHNRPLPSPMTRNNKSLEATVRNLKIKPVQDTEGPSYMGDAEAVREEEEQAMQMMGSKGPLAFHSRRDAAEEQTHSFTIDHLQWLVSMQIITAQQGRKLWGFFADCDPDTVPVTMELAESSDEEERCSEAPVVHMKQPVPPSSVPRNGHYTRKSSIDHPPQSDYEDEDFDEEDEAEEGEGEEGEGEEDEGEEGEGEEGEGEEDSDGY